jgi:transposase
MGLAVFELICTMPDTSPATTTTKNKSGKHPGRQKLPANLPREERIVTCATEPCICQSCGKDKAVIGYEQSEQLDVEPGRYFVVVIDTIVNKYSDHLPLYRQSAILERDTGVSISRATMDGWLMRAGEMLIPVAGAMGRELVAGSYIQADETPVPVQMPDGRGKNHQAFLWQYGKPRGNVVFDFRMGRGRDGPMKCLGQYEGILQTDG